MDDGDILVWNQGAGEWQSTNRGTVPENTSDLVNDGENGTDPFITEADVNSILDGTTGGDAYLKEGDNISLLNNDAGYITDAGVTKIIAGTGIEVAPVEGTGDVTINSTISATEFVGPVDVTSSTVPAMVRSANALYVNTGTGTFSPEWAAVTSNADVTTEATPGDFMMKDLESQASDPWTFIDSNIEPSTDGLWIKDSGKLYPATLTNNVGIGTDAPKEKLHVKGSLLSECVEFSPSQDGAYLIATGNGYNSGSLGWNEEGFQHRLKANNTGEPRVTIDTPANGESFCVVNNGNVGIGTDSPSGKLDVQTANNERVVFDSAGSTSPRISLIRDTGSNYNFVNDLGVYRFYKNETIELYRYTSDTHVWNTEASGEIVRFTSSGNVGIGTDAPSGKLDVQNGVNRAIKFEVDGTSGDNHIKSYQGNGENVRNLRITGQEIAIDTNSSGESQGVNRIKVLTNGNVGIGWTRLREAAR